MEEQFVTYEIALGLKEIHFFEAFEHCLSPFFGLYRKEEDGSIELHTTDESEFQPDEETDLDAPLWQQVVEWFRVIHNYHIAVYPLNKKWCGGVYDLSRSSYITSNAFHGNYEQAREHLILESIEMIKGVIKERSLIVLNRSDLLRDKKNLSLNEITLYDFKDSVLIREDINKARYIVFVDDDGQRIELKYKYKTCHH